LIFLEGGEWEIRLAPEFFVQCTKVSLDFAGAAHKFISVVHRNMRARFRASQSVVQSLSGDPTMYANGAFKNPFDFDFSKFAGEFKFPMVNVESIVESNRKTFAAMTTASTTVVESMKAIAQRQGDMLRAAMEDLSKHGSDVLSAATVEEKAAKQIDFAKKSYDLAIANAKEIGELYAKGSTEAFSPLNDRFAEMTEEVKTTIAKK
jgi:phasin family protein